MSILVTGASGFLGMNLLCHLAQTHPDQTLMATDVHPPEAQDTGRLIHPERITFRALDVCDPQACIELLVTSRPTHVVHAAAVTLTEQTPAAAELTRRVNVNGTENMLRAATVAGSVQRFVLLSSSAVYDQTCEGAICEEEDPLDPANCYAQSKRAAEMLLEAHHASGGFAVVAARIGPVYGPFERTRATRPSVSFISHAMEFLQLGQPVRVAGTDFSRDWTHAGDIAAAVAGLLFSPTLSHRIFNVSAGQPVSARAALRFFIEQGLQVQWTAGDRADIALDPKQSRKPLATERLRRDTGFKPRFDFYTGLASALAAEACRPSRSKELRV